MSEARISRFSVQRRKAIDFVDIDLSISVILITLFVYFIFSELMSESIALTGAGAVFFFGVAVVGLVNEWRESKKSSVSRSLPEKVIE